MTLYAASQELTFRWDDAKQMDLMQDILELFVELWLREGFAHENVTGHDLALLQELAKLTQLEAKSSETWQSLENRLGQLVSRGSTIKLRADF